MHYKRAVLAKLVTQSCNDLCLAVSLKLPGLGPGPGRTPLHLVVALAVVLGDNSTACGGISRHCPRLERKTQRAILLARVGYSCPFTP